MNQLEHLRMPQLPFQSYQSMQSPAEAILSKAVTEKPVAFPTAVTQSAMDKWLTAHQAQFKGQAVAFQEACCPSVHCFAKFVSQQS